MNLFWEYNETYNFFLGENRSNQIPFDEWGQFQAGLLSELSILQELLENGFATKNSHYISVEVEDLLSLSDIQKRILGLPAEYPFSIYIEANGILHQGSFKFKYGFFDFVPNGNRLFFERSGAIIKSENSSYLLSSNQFKVLDAIDEFNELPETDRNFQKNLTCFADIKGLTNEGAALLDSFLENQEIINPDKIQIEVDFDNEVLELKPKIDGVIQSSLDRSFDLLPQVKNLYNVKNVNGGTSRIVIDQRQQEELSKIKSRRRIQEKETIDDIVENPERYFDDDVIDLAYFSERVREIGLYKPKFYPFICPYKSEWIPGFVVRDKVNGEKKIFFKTPNDLAEFENEYNHARTSGNQNFTYNDEEVSTKDAETIIKNARKQFQDKSKPAIDKEPQSSNEVLIIKENAHLLEYIEGDSVPENIEHRFQRIQNLISGISLKQHQTNGIAWMQSVYKENLKGCLLADDMGLGKTLQLLYFIEWHAQQTNDNKPYLIVAPVSILENWEQEYKKFFDPRNLELRFLHGSLDMTKEFSQRIVSDLQQKQIILTNYETLRAYQFNFCAVDYAVAALDEAQKIKTPGTLITNVSKALKADFKIAMTGTPVENSLVDLWCIMDFCVPGLLGNAKDFAKEYQNPLSNEDADISELGKQIRQKVDYFLMRRLKEDVAQDLPEKKEVVLQRTMPDVQFNRYLTEIELAKNDELEGIERRNQILKSLRTIRDISDHPFIADSQIDKFSSSKLIASSAKLQVVVEVLSDIERASEKVIIFADRRETQKMLQQVVNETFNIFPSIINGDTPSSKAKASKSKLSRQQTINRFQEQEGFNVIIMSQLAAGVGLNVTKANHVIHYSRHWNPAKESQATDRAYRIGQEKNVKVYYPMATFPESFQNEDGEKQKSFDEILDSLLKRKKILASSTLFPTEQSEVSVDDMYENVFSSQKRKSNTSQKPIGIEDLDKLTPNLFEAYVAAQYKRRGFKVYLTPLANDKGADVVALSSDVNYLFQAKQSRSPIKNDAVQEIHTAKEYYSSIFGESLTAVVITNNFLGRSASTLADSSGVEIIDRPLIEQLLKDGPIFMEDILNIETKRMEKI